MSLRVLVVDDDRSVRVSLIRVLRARGFQAIGASSGEEALAKALETRPDVIVMDVMMPIRSGAEVARAMRREPELAKIPIIALSASPWQVVDPDPPFKFVLTKPCPMNELVNAITEAVAPGPSRQ